jgi:hypothetical protein
MRLIALGAASSIATILSFGVEAADLRLSSCNGRTATVWTATVWTATV